MAFCLITTFLSRPPDNHQDKGYHTTRSRLQGEKLRIIGNITFADSTVSEKGLETGEKADRNEDSEKVGKEREREEDWKERKKRRKRKGTERQLLGPSPF